MANMKCVDKETLSEILKSGPDNCLVVGPIEWGTAPEQEVMRSPLLMGRPVVAYAYVAYDAPRIRKRGVQQYEKIGGTFWAVVKNEYEEMA